MTALYLIKHKPTLSLSTNTGEIHLSPYIHANMVTKHVKPNAQNENGGIIKVEAPIHVSNVMIIDPKTKKRTRIAKKIDEKGNKQRISVKSKEILK